MDCGALDRQRSMHPCYAQNYPAHRPRSSRLPWRPISGGRSEGKGSWDAGKREEVTEPAAGGEDAAISSRAQPRANRGRGRPGELLAVRRSARPLPRFISARHAVRSTSPGADRSPRAPGPPPERAGKSSSASQLSCSLLWIFMLSIS